MEKRNRNDQTKKSPSGRKKSTARKMKFSKMSKKRKQRYIRRGLLGGLVVAGVIVVALVLNMAYTIIQETEAFNPEKILRYQPFTVLDSNDEPIYTYGAEPVDFEEIPQVMIDAVVAAEDSRYYEHNGFDIPRIISAAMGNIIKGSISSGASTITQQTIKKNYYPNEEQTYTRKIGEIFLAIQADSQMDKDTIITCYLNTVYYGMGPGTLGIKAAASYYFDKEVCELTLPEAAYLAGALNAPSAYDAFYDLELATQRRNTVLYLMEMHGYISPEEYELAVATKLENQLVEKESNGLDYEQYQAYIDAVIEESLQCLYSDQYTEDEIKENRDDLLNEMLRKSITIHTYMNADLQNYLETDIATGYADGVVYIEDDLEVAGSIQDNYNGRILGLLGGRDYVDYTLNPDLEGPKIFGYNRATTGKQSPGSSLKPLIAYGIGIELCDWPTYSSVTDDEFTENGVTLHNWDGSTHGSMSFAKALASSWNIPAVKALKQVCTEVGTSAVKDYINGLGLTINDAVNYEGELEKYGDFNHFYAIGAWAEGVTMVQEANAYATIANGGTYYEPHTINYIEYNNDNTKIMVDEEIAKKATRAVSEQGAFMIRELMIDYTHGVGASGYYYVNTAANYAGIQVGAKTGTSTNADDDVKGYLLACFTPDYAMSFWTGKDNSSEAISLSNISTPRAIAGNVISFLHSDGTVHQYSSAPDGVARATVVLGKEPGETCYLANSYTPDRYKVTGWYKTSNPPAGAQTPSIAALTSFDVQSINDKALKISFGAYDSKYTDIPSNYDPDTNFNPDFMYGRVMYVTVIKDAATGAELLTNSSADPNVNINFDVSTELSVCGRYQFSEADALRSEEVCRTIKPEKVSLAPITYDVDTDDDEATISVSASYPDNQITVTVNGDNGYSRTKQMTGSGSLKFSGLRPAYYTVTIIEKDKKQTNQQSATTNFTIAQNENPTPDPTPGHGD